MLASASATNVTRVKGAGRWPGWLRREVIRCKKSRESGRGNTDVPPLHRGSSAGRRPAGSRRARRGLTLARLPGIIPVCPDHVTAVSGGTEAVIFSVTIFRAGLALAKRTHGGAARDRVTR